MKRSPFSTLSTGQDLPVKFVPTHWQKKSIRAMVTKTAVALLLFPGAGKTSCVLTAYGRLRKRGVVDKILVISKRRIIHNVWTREIEKWGFDYKVAMVHGPKRAAALAEDADLYLMNYENIPWLFEQPRKHYSKFDMLCCDESSMLKNWDSNRTKELKKKIHLFPRRVILSGTPTPNSLEDIFAQIYLLDEGASLGTHITRFRNLYSRIIYTMDVKRNDGRIVQVNKWGIRKGAEEQIYRAVKHLVVRFSSEILDLPPVSTVERVVTMGKKARAVYQGIEEEFIAFLDNNEAVTAANAGVAGQKCRQIANGGVYKDRSRAWTEVHSEKVEELVSLVEELQGYPLLVAYEFDHERQRIQTALPGTPAIYGATKDKETSRLIEQWNRGELPVLLAHPASLAHGVNLQGTGANVCFFSLGWNLENHDQFIQRVHRQGQKQSVLVYVLVCEDTLDTIIAETLQQKHDRQEFLLSKFDALRRKKRRAK